MRRKPLLPLHNVNVKVRHIQAEPLIRNVSDTARWVAFYRAEESNRPDAIFSDPFARRLAGQRGEQIARSGLFTGKTSWPFVARTYLFDRVIQEQVQQGADMVVNLAAGLDARPYRMALPSALRWIEVDLPEILTHKEEILRNENRSARWKGFDSIYRTLRHAAGCFKNWGAKQLGP